MTPLVSTLTRSEAAAAIEETEGMISCSKHCLTWIFFSLTKKNLIDDSSKRRAKKKREAEESKVDVDGPRPSRYYCAQWLLQKARFSRLYDGLARLLLRTTVPQNGLFWYSTALPDYYCSFKVRFASDFCRFGFKTSKFLNEFFKTCS